jgi:diguanylate cyclase (GGDEF)-like protein
MTLVRPDGVVVLNTNAALGEKLPDFRQDEAYLRAFRFDMNNTYSYNIGRNQLGMGVNRWHFPFRHTVQDTSGKPLFVIQAAISEISAELLWSDLPLFPESRVGMIRNDGYIQLVWPRSGFQQVLNKPQSGALMQTIRAHPGMISGAYEGKSSIDDSLELGAFSHLPNAEMAAFVSVPQRLIMTRWWEHNYPILLSFLIYLGVIIVIAFKLSARESEHTYDLLNQSRKDTLTGLPNRLAIDEILAREIARDRRQEEYSAILYLDLDNFKDINDKLGYSSGDRLLERVALRLREVLRQEDVLARLGGDEFLVVLPNSNAEKSSIAAQRIIDVLAAPFNVSGQNIAVSTSIGICIFPDHGDNCSVLLQNADTAMYEAKRQGRNSYVFYQEELGERIRQRLELQQDFLRAIQNQEFILHYQPLVNLNTGKIVGAEALVRWLDPHRGLRNPAEFIPFAEESGIILLLGEWVLKTACRQAKSWVDQGFDIYIAVNLSTRQFQDPNLFSKISNALSDTELPPAKLELEITESASMYDPETSIRVMDKLKSIEIKIAIDDFGTGYSSLAYLKRIPADIIKIDKSFVNGIHNDQDNLAIVRTILALGNSLEKRCLAEGIETAEHFEILKSLGCHFGQGYWMSKPIPATEFSDLLKEDKHYLHQNPLRALTA